ncbi:MULTISPECIES: ribonuclease D [unclassified Haematospirillum]|uniref:ribonuclease D n=1 Tax=unclassified Haematospirillum TaxID=2622088 RepID=UPI00143A3556|nr:MULTISPECIES: ribonuclease D [unclassified Haematospirillum]NKD54735.1 ribonuclease D [Haematospirillum sp. H4890]NKD74573.1 ribonuclease D [Haematospirillum sp. H4485]NKD87543.1 ribonuclease D [Haematospirillum sp. 15-248]
MNDTSILITDTRALQAFCDSLAGTPFITVDTEFMREKTYWPQLCLVQVGGPDEARCIDPLAPGIDLAPLFALMRDTSVLKVFHAARQDLEIFYNMMGTFPTPLFDTQVAAMVCGFGDSVGYETLASKLAKVSIDKSMRFTDWARRPLTDQQVSYALSDVVHLRVIYEKLAARLEETGRAHWLDEEMAVLLDPSNYRVDPPEAWRRLKTRTKTPRFLGIVRELAAWREIEAQTRDIPRQRVLRDEALLEIAAHAPRTVEQLERTRGFVKGQAEGNTGQSILEAVARGKAMPVEDLPIPPYRRDLPPGIGPATDLLRVLLKMRCEEHDVAQKLVADSEDLELIALDDNADVPALKGWRRDVFGADALALKNGSLALCLSRNGRRVEAVEIEG